MSKLLATCDDYPFSSPIEYVLHLFFSIYGVDYQVVPLKELEAGHFDLNETLVISYGKTKPRLSAQHQIHIYASDLFDADYQKPSSLPQIPLKKCNDLPVIYSGHGGLDGWARKSAGLIETNIDIIASSFFMLTRYEEVVSDERDEFNRFPASASLAYKEGFLDRPIVNEYIELLWGWIEEFGSGLERKGLWDDRDFAVCLTHDVDRIRKTLRDIGYVLVRRRDVKTFLAAAVNYLKVRIRLAKDPFDSFDYVTGIEKMYGFSSSFYFIAGGATRYDKNYLVESSKVAQ